MLFRESPFVRELLSSGDNSLRRRCVRFVPNGLSSRPQIGYGAQGFLGDVTRPVLRAGRIALATVFAVGLNIIVVRNRPW